MKGGTSCFFFFHSTGRRETRAGKISIASIFTGDTPPSVYHGHRHYARITRVGNAVSKEGIQRIVQLSVHITILEQLQRQCSSLSEQYGKYPREFTSSAYQEQGDPRLLTLHHSHTYCLQQNTPHLVPQLPPSPPTSLPKPTQ